MALSPEEQALARRIAVARVAARLAKANNVQFATTADMFDLLADADATGHYDEIMTMVNSLDPYKNETDQGSPSDADPENVEPEAQAPEPDNEVVEPEETPTGSSETQPEVTPKKPVVKSTATLEPIEKPSSPEPEPESNPEPAQPEPEPTPEPSEPKPQPDSGDSQPEPQPAPEPEPQPKPDHRFENLNAREAGLLEDLINELNQPDFAERNIKRNQYVSEIGKEGLAYLSESVSASKMAWVLDGVSKEMYPPTSKYAVVNSLELGSHEYKIQADFSAYIERMRANALGTMLKDQQTEAGQENIYDDARIESLRESIDTFGNQFDALAMNSLPGIRNIDVPCVQENIQQALEVQNEVIHEMPDCKYRMGLLRKMARSSATSIVAISDTLLSHGYQALESGKVPFAIDQLGELTTRISKIDENATPYLKEDAASKLKALCEIAHDPRVPEEVRGIIAYRMEERWPEEADLIRYRIRAMVSQDEYDAIRSLDSNIAGEEGKANAKKIRELYKNTPKQVKQRREAFRKNLVEKYGGDKTFMARLKAIDKDSKESIKVLSNSDFWDSKKDNSVPSEIVAKKSKNYLGFKGTQKLLVNSPRVNNYFADLVNRPEFAQPDADHDVT